MIKAFIVDDEEHALNMLELLLKNGGLEVVGRSNNGHDALEQIPQTQPDVLFLDIEMPGMSGLDLADHIRNHDMLVHIVFVTAYDQYAISAFDMAAVDYLLKPVETERLARTIDRIHREHSRTIAVLPLASAGAGGEGSRLVVRLFGAFFAGLDGGPGMKWRTSKEKELLAYLANQEDKRIHRDTIIDNLWPEESYQKAKIYLHTCISLLRKNLKMIGLDGIVKYENGGYYLDPNRICVDVRQYRKRLKDLKQAEYPDAAMIEEALVYHQGPFMPEDAYVWAEQEAEAFEISAYEWRLTLGEKYLQDMRLQEAAETAEKVIESSPYDEEAYRLLMRSYGALGKNNQVHDVYRRLGSKLEELHVRLSEQSRSLYEEICGGTGIH
ncbi:response regulator [Paenibacillus chibensis]|uniref:Response regulator n=1 Tax=Paenibacillus chibensis TaxID=59846 RepID=A0ABU6PUY7_9BACL|nr:response regulator [Paenibacillus chibensis]